MPNERFVLQLWDKDAKLQEEWLPDAFDIVEEEELNSTHTLRFNYLVNDTRGQAISTRKIVRLVDTEQATAVTGVVSVVSVANKQLELASVAGLSVGDYLLIFDDPAKPTKSFVAKISAISSNTVTLSRLDFTPTAGTVEAGATYADLVGLTYDDLVGLTYAELLGQFSHISSTGSPVIKWTGTTFRVWDIQEEHGRDGVHSYKVICQHLSYDLNDRSLLIDARTDVAFALASMQDVAKELVTPSEVLDEVVKHEPQSGTDFTNGWIKGSVDSALTSLVETTYDSTDPGDIDVDVTTRTVTRDSERDSTGFLTSARRGTRLYSPTLRNLTGIVDYVIDDDSLVLQNFPMWSMDGGFFETDADKRSVRFETSGTLRNTVLEIAEVWSDETQQITLSFNEDKSIDVTKVSIPNASDPTSDLVVRVGKNLQKSSRRLDAANLGTAILPSGSTSGWINSHTGIFFKIGANPTEVPYHRNTKERFILDDRNNIKYLRWGDPICVLHRPLRAKVIGFETDQTIKIHIDDIPSGHSATGATSGGSLAAGTYYFRISAIMEAGETPASTEVNGVVAAHGPPNAGKVTVSWGAVSGATGYRVYGYLQGAEIYYHTVTGATSWILFDVAAYGTGANNFDVKGITPPEFEGSSYVNGQLLVYSMSGVDNDSGAGLGQLKTIEAVEQIGLIGNDKFRVRVTYPYDVLPHSHYRIAMSKRVNTALMPIKGFGIFERNVSSGGSFTPTTADTDTRFHGSIVDAEVGYDASFPSGYDVFFGHYAQGLINFKGAAASQTGANATKFSGQYREIARNTQGTQDEGGAAQNDLTVIFDHANLTTTGLPRYELMGPSQLVMEFKDTEWDIDTTLVTTGAQDGLLVTIKGEEVYVSSSTTTYDGSDYFGQEDGTATSGDLADVLIGYELYTRSTASDESTEVLVGIVSHVDFGNKQIYVGDSWLGGTPSNNVTFVVRKPRPQFDHTNNIGNIFSFSPHREEDGGVASPTDLHGFCYIADAQAEEDDAITDWGSGADSSDKFGIGHALRIAKDITYGSGVTALADNQLLLEWDDAATSTIDTIYLKWIVLVRTNYYTWINTESPAHWKFDYGDLVVLLNAETGGKLTIGKALNYSSYVVGLDAIDTENEFDYGGISKRAVPVKSGDGYRFPVDSRIFIGTRPIESAIQYSTRRGSQMEGSVVEVASVVIGADESPTRPFDLLNLKQDLSQLPSPGDRIELLTVQDSASITTYGRVEREETFNDITDPEELYEKGRLELRARKAPVPRYELSVTDLQFNDPKGRYVHESADVGDTIHVIDSEFSIDSSDFRLIKKSRNYDVPLNSELILENQIRTLIRGSGLSTFKAIRRLENQSRLLAVQAAAPKCMWFDSSTRGCVKAKPPNTFCNITDSNRDGKLRKNMSLISRQDCRSFTPNDALHYKYTPQVVSESFTLGAGAATTVDVDVDVDSIANSEIQPGTEGNFAIDHYPEPQAWVAYATYVDAYSVTQAVPLTLLTVAFDKDDDGDFFPQNDFFRTGIKVTITKGANAPTQAINGLLIVVVPGMRT